MENSNNYIWSETYRPSTISDCILDIGIKKVLSEIVSSKKLPNLLFSGSPGTGKTTAAIAICQERDMEYILINASEDGNIDTLRTTIRTFASTISFDNKRKCVILDEADFLNPTSTQPALRGFMQEFSKNCSFIFTCNHKKRIIEALHSRCSCIDFTVTDKVTVMVDFFKRIQEILDTEKVKYDKKVVSEFIKKYFPDFRRIINELQAYSLSGQIDIGILKDIQEEDVSELFMILKKKDFTSMRKYIVNHLDNDPASVFTLIFNNLSKYLMPTSIPPAILILADYQYKNAFVADSEINMTACLTELMFSDNIVVK